MKLSRRLALVALLGVPLALFFAARRASQQRPYKLATIPTCNELTFSSDGKLLIAQSTVSGVQTRFFFDVSTAELVARRQVARDLWGLPLFSPDGKMTARASASVWDSSPKRSSWTPVFFVSPLTSTTERCIKDPAFNQEGNTPPIQSAVWTHDGSELLVADRSHIRRFDVHSGQLLSRAAFVPLARQGQHAPLQKGQEVAIAPDGRQFLYFPSLSFLTIRDTRNANIQYCIFLAGNVNAYIRFGWSQRSRFVWVETNGLNIFDAHTGRLLWRWLGATQPQFSANDTSIVTCNGFQCSARDAQTGRDLWKVNAPSSLTFALSPDGKTIAEARPNGQIFLCPMPKAS